MRRSVIDFLLLDWWPLRLVNIWSDSSSRTDGSWGYGSWAIWVRERKTQVRRYGYIEGFRPIKLRRNELRSCRKLSEWTTVRSQERGYAGSEWGDCTVEGISRVMDAWFGEFERCFKSENSGDSSSIQGLAWVFFLSLVRMFWMDGFRKSRPQEAQLVAQLLKSTLQSVFQLSAEFSDESLTYSHSREWPAPPTDLTSRGLTGGLESPALINQASRARVRCGVARFKGARVIESRVG